MLNNQVCVRNTAKERIRPQRERMGGPFQYSLLIAHWKTIA
jgi:hypothetical protein